MVHEMNKRGANSLSVLELGHPSSPAIGHQPSCEKNAISLNIKLLNNLILWRSCGDFPLLPAFCVCLLSRPHSCFLLDATVSSSVVSSMEWGSQESIWILTFYYSFWQSHHFYVLDIDNSMSYTTAHRLHPIFILYPDVFSGFWTLVLVRILHLNDCNNLKFNMSKVEITDGPLTKIHSFFWISYFRFNLCDTLIYLI